MKIKETDFPNILKNNLAGVPAILIYGPDNGKIGDFVDKIIDRLEVPADNIISADGMTFRDKYDAFYADACSASMFGGNKLLLVHDPDGRDFALLENLCESPSLCAPVIITCGELDGKSTLRKYFEEHERCAALPLYADSEQSLGTLIRAELSKHGVKQIEGDAMSYMLQHLGKDRGIARGFLEKIALYADDKKTVSLEDAQMCLPDAGAASIDDFKFNLTAGNISLTLRALDRLFAENVNAAQLVRVMGGHFKDLTNCVAGGIMPRVFWKYTGLFDAARKIWTEPELSAVLVKLNKLESDTRSGLNAEIIFRDFALKLATHTYKLANIRKKK
ncbi:MAG: DNA polymerase III subunit delta [Rickettsiales bacterium]|nr:DNA polymerase III subunit delta [Rickettsiales bacterium]